jgi:hypothetical protein
MFALYDLMPLSIAYLVFTYKFNLCYQSGHSLRAVAVIKPKQKYSKQKQKHYPKKDKIRLAKQFFIKIRSHLSSTSDDRIAEIYFYI